MSNPIRVLFASAHESAPAAGTGVRIALFQGEQPRGFEEATAQNLWRMEQAIGLAADYDAHLCAFPEAYATGYALNPQLCARLAEPLDGRSVTRARELAAKHSTCVVLPYPERVDSGSGAVFYDTIAVISPTGDVVANYRKTHLYGAAERRMFAFGNELPVVCDINGFPVGFLNCYECEMPPLYQYLAETGARLVIGPTAADYHFRLADGSRSRVPYQDATEHIIPAMASVWKLFVAYCNSRGWEDIPGVGWWQYRGNSGVWAPNGKPIVTAGPADQLNDCLLLADCVPTDHAPFSPEGNHLIDNRLRLVPQLRPDRGGPAPTEDPGD